VDSVWEQEKLEARKMLDTKRAAESPAPSVRCVGRFFVMQDSPPEKMPPPTRQTFTYNVIFGNGEKLDLLQHIYFLIS